MWEKTSIIITTINKSTKAIETYRKFAENNNAKLIIVGDKKTPDFEDCENMHYLSIEKQIDLFPSFANLIPYNHYCRKNIGYLYAISNGSEYIFDTDDDNIPYEKFKDIFNLDYQNKVEYNSNSLESVNIYKYFSKANIWPRGIPLKDIHNFKEANLIPIKDELSINEFPIIQFLANKDPDVDSIYRFIFPGEINFEAGEKIILLGKNIWCPFNSQATLIHKSVFPLLYLPCHVSFRMTDIWRSFIAQSFIKSVNKKLAFAKPIVYQDRNPHNLMKDFSDEIDGYLLNESIIKICSEFKWNNFKSLKEIYKKLGSELSCIRNEEIKIIEEWLKFFNT